MKDEGRGEYWGEDFSPLTLEIKKKMFLLEQELTEGITGHCELRADFSIQFSLKQEQFCIRATLKLSVCADKIWQTLFGFGKSPE